MLNIRKTLQDAHAILSEQNIDHALIGGFALAVYGQHRATVDVDFLADGERRDIIKSSFLAKGFSLKYESVEVLQFVGSGFVDILLANRPLSREMLNQAIKHQELGVYVVRPEDIIGLKIQAYKNDPSRELQDKSDIQRLLNLPNLDLNRVKKYADLFQEWTVIKKLKGIS